MNDRLEIALRIMAAYRGFDIEHANAPSEAIASWALKDADALIAAERETRPPKVDHAPDCKHERTKVPEGQVVCWHDREGNRLPVCLACGLAVSP